MRDNRKGPSKDKGPRINEDIRISECRLVGEEEQYGVVSISRAREIAEELGLDLVEIAPTAKPPVVKVIDYGKYKYELQKKLAEAKKKQAKIVLKEIQLRPNIEKHDLDTKLKRAQKFLEDGDKVKFVMQFRGREMAYKDMGKEKFDAIIATVCEFGAAIESPAKLMGNRIITILAPTKKK
ncbi:translation initiation factor IF-3 [Bacteriovorax sp. Seq25_V]|uniref:translation initiation factor IF-3 n=1 Tax=Bacteriovorax sp. Seq25_V TaxID=1201288 RepID=UPI0005534374